MSLISPDYRVWADDFSPGFLDTPDVSELPDGAMPEAANGFFSRVQIDGKKRASLKKRPGDRLVAAVAMALGKAVDGLCEFTRIGASNELIAVCNGTVYRLNAGGTAFEALTGGTGFTAGQPVRFLVFRDQLFMSDGTLMKRYNGTACFTVGFAAPTAAPGLADGGAGTLPAGTWEGYAVWHDSTTDHESNPSATTAQVVLAASHQRTWTKPAGAPPSNVDNWRVYCRRVDTAEIAFFRTVTVPIATASISESTSDTARRDAGTGPASSDNAPPVSAFAVWAAWKGYVIAAAKGSQEFSVSKLGDAESYHPKDKLNARSGGRDIRVIRTIGMLNSETSKCILQTPTRSFVLRGDRMPFIPDEAHPNFGCVAQEAGVEVGGDYYAWDETKGPYRTDFAGTWEMLGAARVQGIIESATRGSLSSIRAVHDEQHHLVIWALPLNGSTRCRTLLAYHYLLGAWLPPITGLEYTALCSFTNASGVAGVYAGDQWGRVHQLFVGTRIGPATGTVLATVTGATASTVTAADAAFYTTGDGLAGLPVAVVSPAGQWQLRRIQSNTATQITLDTTNDVAWSTTPLTDGTWQVVVGPITWFVTTKAFDCGEPDLVKRGGHVTIDAHTGGSGQILQVDGRFNESAGVEPVASFRFGDSGAAWGVAVFGTSLWGSGGQTPRRMRLERTFLSLQIRAWNFYPDETAELKAIGLTADALPRRRVPGAAA
jgi:hypothetical protein